jgi:hypothetical protein
MAYRSIMPGERINYYLQDAARFAATPKNLKPQVLAELRIKNAKTAANINAYRKGITAEEASRLNDIENAEIFTNARLRRIEKLQDAIRKIGEEELMNCVLVQEGVRNAFLLQYIDYGERSHNEPISKQKLAGIKEYFPELIQSRNVQGMIISKNIYTYKESYNEATLGKILGFPCSDEFMSILDSPEKSSATIEIIVHFYPGVNKNNVQVLVYRCKDLSHFPEAVALAKEAEHVLKNNKFVGLIVKNVEARKTIELGQIKRVNRTRTFRKRGRSHRRSQASQRQREDQVRQ